MKFYIYYCQSNLSTYYDCDWNFTKATHTLCRHTINTSHINVAGIYSRDRLFSMWSTNWILRNQWLSKYLDFYEENTRNKTCGLLWDSWVKQLSVEERITRSRLSQSGPRTILRSRHVILHKNQNKVVTPFRLHSKDSLIITKRLIGTIPEWRRRKYCVLQTLSWL